MNVNSVNNTDSEFSKYSLSFAGCGFLCVYHTGVCAALKEYAPRLLENVLCGASAGSLIAAAVACGICMSKATSVLLHVVVQARSVILGAFNNDFDLMRIIEKDLQALLPDNAHELCSGRVRISLTRVEDLKNVVISEYHSKEDLIQAIICSCFIPVYAGFYYPQFRGETYIDGGVTDNQPSYGENTLTVSPFSGEADICPRDEESASMLNLNFGGTSIRFTTNNLQRFMFCLFPPSPDVCSQICRQGFSDTLRFLVNNGLSAKASSVILEANYVYTPKRMPIEKDEILLKVGFLSEGEEQIRVYKNHGVADFLSRSKIGHLFPIIMENAFDEKTIAKVGVLTDFIFSFKFVKLANNFLYPVMTSVHLFRFSKSLSVWMAGQMVSHWFVRKIQDFSTYLIDLLGEKIASSFLTDFGETSLEGFTQLLELREVEYDATTQESNFREKVVNLEMTLEKQQKLETLRNLDLLASDTNLSIISENEGLEICSPDDTHESLIKYSWAHDAALAFYYTDENNKVHICEIIGETSGK